MNLESLRKATMVAALGGLVAMSGGCDDLDVTNPNAPDRERALATASDVASLIGGTYRSYYFATQGWGGGTGVALASYSDEISGSWGNAGLRDFGEEPRQPIDNSPVYSYASNLENGWYNAYSAVVGGSDGLRAIEEREEVASELGSMERAFANFAQGLGLGWVALQFDQGVIWDETSDPQADQSVSDYNAVMDAALANMQEALDLANSNSFSTNGEWMNGKSMSSSEMARYIHSLMARWMVSVNRTPSEASGRSDQYWDQVIAHVDQGIQQPFTIPASFSGGWWSGIKSFGGYADGFVRADYRTIGPADVSGQYQAWEDTPPPERQPFVMETPDKRIQGWAPGPNGMDLGKYYRRGGESNATFDFGVGPSPFPPIRGTWFFSDYASWRYVGGWPQYGGHACFGICNAGGGQPLVLKTEMDLLKAEAYLMKGQPGQAVPIINRTRVGIGELPPVDVNGPPQGADCVPKTMDGACGDLMEALQHEKRMEVYQVSAGISYFDDRRWGDLLPGTAIHFPVPGKELGALGMDFYTYGGDAGGTGASSVPIPGQNGYDIMDRIDWSLDAMKKFQSQFTENPKGRIDKQ